MRLMPWFLSLSLCVALSACQQPQPRAIEDDPGEQAKAQAAASRYFESFVNGDLDAVLTLSVLPFWGDGDRIEDRAVLTEELTRQLQSVKEQGFDVKVESTHFMTLEQARVVLPSLYERIQETGFAEVELYVVALRVRLGENEEHGVILVRQDDDGLWKVMGIGD